MELTLDRCVVRGWRTGDIPSLVKHANNRKIWLNLRDRFPHPYTRSSARGYLRLVRGMRPPTFFAIAVGDEAVGSVGYAMQQDVERVSAEVGYWLGEDFWGQGIATEALRAITRYAVAEHQLTRLFAVPFANNVGSCRVLEKAGYLLEAHLRRSAIKDGVILDQCQYAYHPKD